jgi:hypothetical protein
MKKQKVTYTVHIWDLDISERYFEFKYSVAWDFGFEDGTYSSDHVWADDIEGFRKLLDNGYAAQLAIENAL